MADGQGQPGQMQMPQDPAVQVFANLTQELTNVSQALTAQGISNIVLRFDGNPKKYREWIKSIEKYAVLVNVPEARKKLIAYQSSGGAVSGFVQRYMTANPDNTWAQLKEQLAVRFSDVTDAQMALSLLRRVKQKQGESIQNYSERILSLAEEAYNNQGGNAVERQLIDIFVDGLTNDQFKMKILREQPNTLQGAVATATNEQNLKARVQMSHQGSNTPTSMEVDHSRGQQYKFNRFKKINSTQNRPSRCWTCGQMGHISRDCRSKEERKPPMGHGQSRGGASQSNNQGN